MDEQLPPKDEPAAVTAVAVGCVVLVIGLGLMVWGASWAFGFPIAKTISPISMVHTFISRVLPSQKPSEGGSVAGVNVSIPSDFPPDVPLYPSWTINGVVGKTLDDIKGFWLTAQTLDTVSQVHEFYLSALQEQGWQIQQVVREESGVSWSAVKDQRMVNISCTKDQGTSQTMVVLSVSNRW